MNLYIIIKSYLSSIAYPFTEIVINIKKESDIIVTERVNSASILKMNYYEFQKWCQFRIKYDLKYYKEGCFYCFSFISNWNLVKKEDVAFLKPIFPWKESILNENKSIENKEFYYEKIIEKKNKQIFILKKKFLLLKKNYRKKKIFKNFY